MKIRSPLPVLGCVLASASVPTAQAALAAYVHIYKNDAETRFHVAEVEAFASSVVPNGLGGATSFLGGLTTSTNDIGDGTLMNYGSGNAYPVIGTTGSIQHGGVNENPNNVLETAGNVWSTNTGLATRSQYTLDLSGTFDVTTVRLYPRNEACCPERWRNLEIQLLDAARNPIPGTFRTFAGGTNTAIELTFAPVPEPGSLMLLGLAGAGLVLRRRR